MLNLKDDMKQLQWLRQITNGNECGLQNVPEDILKNITGQIRQLREVPKRLDEYTQDERDAFPRLFEWSVHVTLNS